MESVLSYSRFAMPRLSPHASAGQTLRSGLGEVRSDSATGARTLGRLSVRGSKGNHLPCVLGTVKRPKVRAPMTVPAVLVAALLLVPQFLRAEGVVTNCTSAIDFLSKLTNGGRIVFACSGTITLTDAFVITNNTYIDGSNNPVILRGNGSARLFTVNSNVALTLTNLTLASGVSTNGGAIYNNGGILGITNCVFALNTAMGSNGLAGANGHDDDVNGSNAGSGRAGTTGLGGAIYNLGQLWLNTCLFETNSAVGGSGGNGGTGGNADATGGDGGDGGSGGNGLGGAIYNLGRLALTNCTFTDNNATGGGAGQGGAGGAAAFGGLPGSGSAGGAGSGGAIYSLGFATNHSSTFSFNIAHSGNSSGGGVKDNGDGKEGRGGVDSLGGGFCNLGTNIVINCTFFQNEVTGGNGGNGGDSVNGFSGGDGGDGGSGVGGGLYNAGRVSVTNCTFAESSATGGAGGMPGNGPFDASRGSQGASHGGYIGSAAGVFTLKNSILANPPSGTTTNITTTTNVVGGVTNIVTATNVVTVTGVNSFGTISNGGYNISTDATPPFGNTSTSTNNTDPLLDTALNNNGGPTLTLALLDGSPAIDQITDPAECPEVDQRGQPRPNGDGCDIGAFEFGPAPPFIISQPSDQSVTAGTNALFIVVAGGEEPLLFQWRFEGFDLFGETNDTLTVTNVQAIDAGHYDVVIENDEGSVTSRAALLSVTLPPTITMQPTNATVNQGSSATFTVTVTGEPPLNYQWRVNGTNILGATSNSYTLSNVQSVNAGDYSVLVINNIGSTLSSNATLTVVVPPVITNQPTSMVVTQGSAATFSVGAGGLQLQYQWFFNNGSSPITNATNATLTISVVQTTNAGNYFVVVRNGAGATVSLIAALAVRLPPAISVAPVSTNVSRGAPATFSVVATGEAPLSYQWLFNASPVLGATGSNFSLINAQLSNAGPYSVVVSNAVGSVTSAVATLTVVVPLTIVMQPLSQTVTQNTRITFFVVAESSGTLSYQWLYNGANLVGSTSSNLTINNVKEADEGSYEVIVSNNLGERERSNPAILSIVLPPAITQQPVGLTVLPGSNATFTVVASGGVGLLTYQWRFNGSNIAGATTSSYTVANAQTTNGGTYSVVVANSEAGVTSSNALLRVLVAPTLTQISYVPPNFQITFQSQTALTYTLEFKNSLGQTNWTSLPPSLTGTGAALTLTDPAAVGTNRVYRLRVE
jgi:hypothetical protein